MYKIDTTSDGSAAGAKIVKPRNHFLNPCNIPRQVDLLRSVQFHAQAICIGRMTIVQMNRMRSCFFTSTG